MSISEHLRKHEKFWSSVVLFVSLLVVFVVAYLLTQFRDVDQSNISKSIYLLPQLNAVINSVVTILLVIAFIFIKNKRITAHKFTMLGALGFSVLFLISYVIYHYSAPHTPYGGDGTARVFYFFILLTHILLAIFIIPMALFTVFKAFQGKFNKHRKIARWTLPLWLYVSITGVLIYLMISPYYPI